MLKVTKSKSGLPNIMVGEINLHSPYDPLKESKRFITSTIKEQAPACILLLGAALDYLTEACRESFPESRVICIFFDAQVFNVYTAYQHSPVHRLAVYWHPGLGMPLATFLKNQLSELDLEGLEILEWKPSVQAFPVIARESMDTLTMVITELRSSLVTIGTFGKLWIRNTLANFLSIDSIIKNLPCRRDYPIVIVASGPSLETSVPILKPLRPYFSLWALPSSIPLLVAHSLIPDLVVVTDPGYYSLAHLEPLKGLDVAIACPLSAVRGLGQLSSRIYLLRQPHFFEEVFLKKSLQKLPPLFPPQGTVAATALQLAFSVTEREIIFCGLDFCYEDFKAHAFPHLSQWLCQVQETRLSPVYDQLFKLAQAHAPQNLPQEIKPRPKQARQQQRTSAPLLAYANWFSRLGKTGQTRLFRLQPGAVSLESFTPLDEAGFKLLFKKYPELPPPLSLERDLEYPDYENRVLKARQVLTEWESLILDKLAALKSLSWQEQLNLLTGDMLLFDFLYFFDLAGLLKLKKELRLSGSIPGANQPGALFEKALDFVRELNKKATNYGRRS